MYFLLKMGDFPASHVSLPEGSPTKLVKFDKSNLFPRGEGRTSGAPRAATSGGGRDD